MESDWVAFREKFMKALETGEDFSEVLRLSSPMKGKPEEIMIAGAPRRSLRQAFRVFQKA